MSKFVAKFRPEKDYNDDYAFKPNPYERKKRDKQKDEIRQSKYYDPYESDWRAEGRRKRK